MLSFLLSQPRSGSTVLSAMLDRCKGVVCMPETSFPQIFNELTDAERSDPRRLGALYLGGTFPPLPKPPTPLSLDEAAACMTGDLSNILQNLGRAVAVKIGRNPLEVRHIVYKTTRTPGMTGGPLSTGGQFILLRRNSVNVYDSQFRVDFGRANRNPFRYGIFLQSYEFVFSRLPKARTFEIEYEEIPARFSSLLNYLGIEDEGYWDEGQSTMDMVAASGHWLHEATKEFSNLDPQKRAKISIFRRALILAAISASHPLRPFMEPLRAYYDRLSLNHIRMVADMHLKGLIG